MVKISTIFGLGILVAVMQFFGFSMEIKNYFYILSGLLIATLSIIIRKELHEVVKHLHDVHANIKNDTFVENNPKQKEGDNI